MNISWSQALHLGNELKFAWMVNNGSRIKILSSNTTYYLFNVLEDTLPCEVYNFSVTATYVGATYTGADCIPHSYSQILSVMLPSLPDINILEETIQFTLTKISMELTLVVSFDVSLLRTLCYSTLLLYAYSLYRQLLSVSSTQC